MTFIYNKLIKNYISKLTPNDIKYYAENKKIGITNTESLLIYNFILKYNDELLDGNNKILELLKPKISENLYQEITKLYKAYFNS